MTKKYQYIVLAISLSNKQTNKQTKKQKQKGSTKIKIIIPG